MELLRPRVELLRPLVELLRRRVQLLRPLVDVPLELVNRLDVVLHRPEAALLLIPVFLNLKSVDYVLYGLLQEDLER